jgi:hypothetical protein
MTQHEHLEKLNMQAILSASANETEYVKDSIVSYEKVNFCNIFSFCGKFKTKLLFKMPTLVHELISVELWKEKIFSELANIDFKPKNTFIVYLIVCIIKKFILKLISFSISSCIMKQQ